MRLGLPRSWRDALEFTSRLGYAARGVVYLMMGVVEAAFRRIEAPRDLTPT